MFDLSLYVLVDPDVFDDRQTMRAGGLARKAADAARGGAGLIQYRDKTASTREMVDTARQIVSALSTFNVPLLINDRVDVAVAVDADGVHVGQDDMEPVDARRILGEDAIIGQTIKTLEQANKAPIDMVDYVCIGGVFETSSKINPQPPIGITGLKECISTFRYRDRSLAVAAIAGIDHENAAFVIEAGADGIAVNSAVTRAPDVFTSARHLRSVVDRAKQSRG